MNKEITRIIKNVLVRYDQEIALKKLCSEFEHLGYEVILDGVKITSETAEFAASKNPVTFSLYGSGVLKEEFSIKFPA